MADPLDALTARLEAAAERLARAAARPRGAAPEEIAELGRRLDATLARLKLALAPEEVLSEDGSDDGTGELPSEDEFPDDLPDDPRDAHAGGPADEAAARPPASGNAAPGGDAPDRTPDRDREG